VHWEHRSVLTELVPAPLLEHARYVLDGDRLTAAGGTAALDMMCALIASRHGTAFARDVGDWFLHTDLTPPAAPQRSGLVERWGTTSAPLIAALGAMESHVDDPLALEQLAALAGVGPRQLNRLFRARFGRSVAARYRELRLERARELLARTSLPVAEVARATGFANATHFARRFRETFGLSPTRLRAGEGFGRADRIGRECPLRGERG